MTGCNVAPNAKMNKTAIYQKEISRISRYENNIPSNYMQTNYRQKALELDMLLFDQEKEGQYLPLIWEDTTYDSFGIPAYVGDKRMHKDGEQEAVTVIAAILSATQLGIDKSSQDNMNYVRALHAFYSKQEHIILNNPSGNSETTSMWYLIYPAILFSQVSILYPDENEIREMTLDCMESWFQAYQIMYRSGSFDYTGFNFQTMEPYRNGIWTEPDCVAGISVLLYYGYEMTGNTEYLEAAKTGMQYLHDYFGSPLYEALLYFGPYMAAMFNTKFSTSYLLEDMINDVLGGNSIPRGGWGSIVGGWGDYSMNGLMGSISDGGGYAFAMNTFTAAYAMSPVAKYDTRFASSLGKWYLNLIGNSRYFFADQTETENQSAALSNEALAFKETTNSIVPYEGIRKSLNSKTPWFGGDPTVYGWAETDFSLYSGVHLGFLAAICEETNVEGILRIDLNKADLYGKDYPAYLLYNPYGEEKQVDYKISTEGRADLFNSVTKEYIAKGVSGIYELNIGADNSVVVIEFPAGTVILHDGITYKAAGKIFGSDGLSVSVTNYENNTEISGNFQLEIGYVSTLENDKVKEILVNIGEMAYTFDKLDQLTFKSGEFEKGSRTFEIKIRMESGLEDQTEIRLNIK